MLAAADRVGLQKAEDALVGVALSEECGSDLINMAVSNRVAIAGVLLL
ncbi:hypothetical protein N836_13335 [Leptolyngbya sp. Heron Island J]|nr:hypothetical protein N836_13335 [Leptolyngbya sp. Heron Island J]